MCGICGELRLGPGPAPRRATLSAMVRALDHRGPEDAGIYLDDQVGLGHTRLAIIDVAGGAQPMASADREQWIVFNGEIFDHVEIAERLRSRGHRFRSRSDTEVILAAYREWGADCVEHFNGQFAFALWDRPRRRLLLARDRVGIRPLYLHRLPGRLLFASEAKSLLQHPEAPRGLDPEGLAQVFTFWGPHAPRSALRGVTQLPPGSTLLLHDGESVERRFWRASFPRTEERGPWADESHAERKAGELRDLLEDATRLRMLRSDVPVGVYVSGGLDSSVIAALVRRFHAGPLSTFSLRFAHEDFDEGRFQREMVQRLGTEHHELSVGYSDIAAAFPDVVRATEAPLLRTAAAPLFLLSAAVRARGFKVVLTGEGADEVFGGYDIFREARVRQFWARHPGSELRPRLLERLYPWLSRAPSQTKAMQRSFFARGLEDPDAPEFSHKPRWDSARGLQRLFSPELQDQLAGWDPVPELCGQLPEAFGAWDPLARAQFLEMETLLSDYLLCSQGDRMLMAHSVEGRFPFLDHRVLSFAARLPPELKLRVLDEKHLLKRAARDLVPPSILQRPKQPYRAPDAQSFVQPGAPAYVAELLAPEALAHAGVFRPQAVERLLAKIRSRPGETPSNIDNMALVGVLSTQLLHHLFVDGAGLALRHEGEPRVEWGPGVGPEALPGSTARARGTKQALQ